jgi:hypothetical protein
VYLHELTIEKLVKNIRFSSFIYLFVELLPRTQSIHQTSGVGIPSIFFLTSIQTDRVEPQFLHVPS